MNTLLKFSYFAILCLMPTVSNAQTFTELFYVTQNGSGSKTGQSFSGSWALADFHNLDNWSSAKAEDGKIGPNDIIYFSGIFTDRVVVKKGGTDEGSITLDGYKVGDCKPLVENCNESAVLNQGMEVGNGAAGPDYLIIQDFKMTRNNSTNAGFRLFPNINGTNDQANIDHTIVRRNTVYQTNGTLFSWYGGDHNIIESNKFVHFGQNSTNATQAVNLIKLDHSLIKGNEFGHDEDAFPSGCTSANIVELHGCHYLVVENNNIYGAPSGAGLVPKEGWGGNSNLVIRFNKVHHNEGMDSSTGGTGIYFRTLPDETNSNFYVYGNLIYENSLNIYMGDVAENIYLWSNIVSAAKRVGIGTWNKNINGLHIYNNTIVCNNTFGETNLSRGGISLVAANSKYYLENNILWNNHPSGEANRKQIYSSIPFSSLEHNLYYHSKGDPTIYYDGGYRTIDVMRTNFNYEKIAPLLPSEDPLFENPINTDKGLVSIFDDYRLKANSPVIDSAKSLSGSFSINIADGDSWFIIKTGYNIFSIGFNDALNPLETDWNTNPPIVSVVKQDNFGSGWEPGAYVYIESSSEVAVVPSPSNAEIVDVTN